MTDNTHPCPEPLPGYKEIQPMVFSGIYPVDSSDYEALKTAMGKLQINDAAFTYSSESSTALGFGFRCGFLGLLHMEIIQERLRREFDMDVISTYPSVIYQVTMTDGTELIVDNPTLFPDPQGIQEIREPIVNVYIMVPGEYIGDMMQLVLEKRGEVTNTETIDDIARHAFLRAAALRNPRRFQRQAQIHDPRLRLDGLRTRRLPRRENGQDGHAHRRRSGRGLLHHRPPRQGRSPTAARSPASSRKSSRRTSSSSPSRPPSAARSSPANRISAMRKNVTAKCYGGDITRKRKLLEKQKEGKKKMKMFGKVNIPQDAFIKVLKSGD